MRFIFDYYHYRYTKKVAGSASGGCTYGTATGQTLKEVRSRPTTEEGKKVWVCFVPILTPFWSLFEPVLVSVWARFGLGLRHFLVLLWTRFGSA